MKHVALDGNPEPDYCTTPDDGLRTETCSGGNRKVKRIAALTVTLKSLLT
jgi:hypothetical protein